MTRLQGQQCQNSLLATHETHATRTPSAGPQPTYRLRQERACRPAAATRRSDDTPANHPSLPGRQSHADTHSSLALSTGLPAPRCYPPVIPLFRPAVCPTLLSIRYPSVSPGRLPHAERDRLPARVQSCPSRLQPRATPTCASSLLGNADQRLHNSLVALPAGDDRLGARVTSAWVCLDVDSLGLDNICVTLLSRA